ncbi:glycosyl hydrolase [Opitutus sp. ER46]|uniref:glycosyl hydrolase n=1 Tax=Opitutus sp. ER46 TaxID=2161864 RepID=UPI000D2FF54E|nr:glycosyl hydrolase [Opitutus sp. ER46]PTX95615.1 glycosyl hydrolase family 2 [Opitutus sp. ER46]
MPRSRLVRFSAALLCLILINFRLASAAADPTPAAFLTPAADARPGIWWFWGESVTTDHGITRDLEALQRAGFGSVVLYEQVFSDAPDALKSLSPEWLARVRFAAAECARLGLAFELNVGPGFVAGGPWITPELGMQRLVGTETTVEGGRTVALTLPQPASKLDYYRDVAVLAYPTPAALAGEVLPVPQRASFPAGVDLTTVFDAANGARVRLAPPANHAPVLIQLDYGAAVTLRSLTYSLRPNAKALVIATQVPTSWADDFYGENMRLNPPIGELEASTDGASWQRVCQLPAIGYQHDSWTQQTVAFPATTARYFRLNLHDWGRNERAKDDDLLLARVSLSSVARVDHWESKSGNVADFAAADRTPDYAPAETLDPTRVVDLTSRLAPDGKLSWDAPPGRWTIFRLGHTPTGAKTKHGRPESAGLECDKLSAAAARVQFEHYVGVILREIQAVPGARLASVTMDSNEHGAQNWTADFAAQFERRRGYPITRYLPAMLGRVVGSRAESDRFLHDVRRTIADLMSDEYFGGFQRLCHEHGLTLIAQAPGIATCLPSDNFQAKGRTDTPMGEFWMTQSDGTIDCKEAASAAHLYGLPVAAAEAFTGSRAEVHPAMMKPFADAALALGINRFVVLAYVHQPWDDRKPGVTEPRFYLPYQRHNTWWEDSAGFWATLTRSASVLRQGLPVSDVLYHLGSDTPAKIATWRMRPAPPDGYDYDVCTDDALIRRTSVRDGRIVLPDGMSYTLLVLAGGDRLSLAAARHLKALVVAGAVVLGPTKPVGSPSLGDAAAGDAEVRRIADELWGAGPLATRGVRQTGAGRVCWGQSPAAVLAALGVPRDFDAGGTDRLDVLHAHRRTTDREIYFIANHRAQPRHVTATFRVRGRTPQLWHPETGAITSPAAWRPTADGRTEVNLPLEAHASVFVVFGPTTGIAPAAVAPAQLVAERPVLQTLTGPWQVSFASAWGGPAETSFAELAPWNATADPGIRHYSGAAVYRKSFDAPATAAGRRVLLDLGDVAVLASVKLNGRDLGTVWKAPFAVDATAALQSGRNELEVRVVNTWVNRLIADAGLPANQRLTWTTDNPYRPTDSLVPSGLLGPVRLRLGDKRD